MPSRSPANVIWSVLLVLASVVMCSAAWQLHVGAKNVAAAATKAGVVPPGTVSAFAGATAPDGWLLCDGQLIRDEKYAALREVLRTGSWDGSGDRVPDLRGMFLRGAHGNARDDSYKELAPRVRGQYEVGSFQDDQTRSPRDGIQFGSEKEKRIADGILVIAKRAKEGDWLPLKGEPSIQASDVANYAAKNISDPETCPKNAAVNWIIKY